MIINSRGFWENETAEGHGVDEGLAIALKNFFRSEALENEDNFLEVIDIGCGTGYYTNYIQSDLVGSYGYDGNPHTKKIAGKHFDIADFSIPQYLGEYDWVLSLEVGEHIPAEYEDIFIDNLHRHNRQGVVLSWAVPGQGGDGHVNCRSNEYIIDKFEALGYELAIYTTNYLRNSCAKYPIPCYWFRDTLLVFRKNE